MRTKIEINIGFLSKRCVLHLCFFFFFFFFFGGQTVCFTPFVFFVFCFYF